MRIIYVLNGKRIVIFCAYSHNEFKHGTIFRYNTINVTNKYYLFIILNLKRTSDWKTVYVIIKDDKIFKTMKWQTFTLFYVSQRDKSVSKSRCKLHASRTVLIDSRLYKQFSSWSRLCIFGRPSLRLQNHNCKTKTNLRFLIRENNRKE